MRRRRARRARGGEELGVGRLHRLVEASVRAALSEVEALGVPRVSRVDELSPSRLTGGGGDEGGVFRFTLTGVGRRFGVGGTGVGVEGVRVGVLADAMRNDGGSNDSRLLFLITFLSLLPSSFSFSFPAAADGA